MPAPPMLLTALCLVLVLLLYLGLARVERSFSQVMLFLTEQGGAVQSEPSEQTGLPGKTDRLPFRPKGNDTTR